MEQAVQQPTEPCNGPPATVETGPPPPPPSQSVGPQCGEDDHIDTSTGRHQQKEQDEVEDPAQGTLDTTDTPTVSVISTVQPNGAVGNGAVKNGTVKNVDHVEMDPSQEALLEDKDREKGTGMDKDKKKGPKLKGRSLRDLDTNQRYLLGALCILYFALYALLSLIGPFFPIEAEKKGLSPFEMGVVISMSWLVMFFMAPLVGFLGTKIRLHYLTTGGVATAGLVSILFGCLQFVHSHKAFLSLALILRFIEGLSAATFCVTAWSVLIATMGDCIQMSMAVLMAVQGVAVIVSPLLGGVLYAAGGFITPFASLGAVVMLSTPLSWWVIRKVPVCERTDVGSVKDFVSNVGVFITALFVTSFTLTFKFLESYVALYIKEQFDYGPQMAGIILSLACLSFVITVVIWAQVIRLIGCVPVMVMGSLLGVVVLSFVAPGHYLHFEAQPWQVFSMTCLFGVAFAASQSPAVPRLLELAKKRNMPDTYLTYGLVSACYNCAFDLGCFTGPLVGGTMYNYLGFGWSTFSLGILLTVIGLLVLLQYLWERYHKKKGERSHLLSGPPEKVALSQVTESLVDGSTVENGVTPGEKEVKRPRSVSELSSAAMFTSP